MAALRSFRQSFQHLRIDVGVMTRCYFGLVRYLVLYSPPTAVGVMVLIFGRSPLFWRHLRMKEHDIKKLLAYSSIENVGICSSDGFVLISQSTGFSDLAPWL